MGTQDPDKYLAVLKASYDYDPQSDDEIAIKEDQILFLLEKVDEDWWKVKVKGDSQEAESPIGLVPAAYVEQAEHKSTVKVIYDYEAAAPGELSVHEDEILLVFEKEEDWLLVQSQADEGRAGYIPGNYVEEASESESHTTPSIIVPPSPPRPVAPYVDPADRVASSKVTADDIKTWSISEIDKKGKKKKGTLGVGNGAVFFASEADKTPVQKWQTTQVTDIRIEKTKHLHLNIGGSSPISLHFNAGSKDNAEEIMAKVYSSKALSTPAESESQDDVESTSPPRSVPPVKESKKVTVHFSPASPVIIPRQDDEDQDEEDETRNSNSFATKSADANGQQIAQALYDFTAAGDDELSVIEGEQLTVLEIDGDEWWKCRNSKGLEGVVPASYLEAITNHPSSSVSTPVPEKVQERAERTRPAATSTPVTQNGNDRRQQQEEEERQEDLRLRAEKERKKAELRQQAKLAAAAESERARRKAADPNSTTDQPPPPSSFSSAKKSVDNTSSSSGKSSSETTRPPPEKTRVWHDRSGQFRVEAAFLGFNSGKLRLHKINGVIVEVPSEKMSLDDMRYVEKIMGRKSRNGTTPAISEDDIPLALSRPSTSAPPSTNAKPTTVPPQKKAPRIDWFDFFLSAGCDLDDCTRYATAFERDKIDETILSDITEGTMRSIGVREGDIIRITKAIEKRKPTDNLVKPNLHNQEQIRRDEELARQLQDQDGVSARRTPPNLFAGPGGVLKNPRRGRPQPSKSVPSNVDLSAISTTSEHIQRTSSPQAVPGRPSSAGPQATPKTGSVNQTTNGFEDDAWTNRPSSTKPLVGTPPPTTPRPPSIPPVAAPPAMAELKASRTSNPPAPLVQPSQPTTSLAKKTESDVFDQLARLSELRKSSTPASVPPSSPPVLGPQPPNPGYQASLVLSSSPAPVGQQLQNQQMPLFSSSPQPLLNSGPRGPYAPVPANQGLLQPLIPTQTGFNSFVPTRPGSNISPFNNALTPPSFLSQQPTGISGPQPMQMQHTAMPVSQMIPSQTTGLPFSNYNTVPTFQNNEGFGQVQNNMSNTSNFNPGLSQTAFTNMLSSPTNQPMQPATNSNTAPANVFAQMKSGTFAADDDGRGPQSSDKYDALRPTVIPQATGWGQSYPGYMGYQH